MFYDGLIFDDRDTDDLFKKNNKKKPLYADILKRWSEGFEVTQIEQKILSKILLFYPEYVIKSNHVEDFVKFLTQAIERREDIQKPDNHGKGLLLYTLFYLLMKKGEKEAALNVITELENAIHLYNLSGTIIFSNESIIDFVNKIQSVNTDDIKIQKAYFKIISLIFESKELLYLGPNFDLMKFPVPLINLFLHESEFLRGLAIKEFKRKSYSKAQHIYKFLRIVKFHLPGTYIHMVRIELALGNLEQAEIYAAIAWSLRSYTTHYELVRILYTIVLVNMLQSKPFETWLACLKDAISNSSCIVEWEMEDIISQYEEKLTSEQKILLNGILCYISLNKTSEELNNLTFWKDLIPIKNNECQFL